MNPHGGQTPPDFESGASSSSATPAASLIPSPATELTNCSLSFILLKGVFGVQIFADKVWEKEKN